MSWIQDLIDRHRGLRWLALHVWSIALTYIVMLGVYYCIATTLGGTIVE